MSEIIIPFEVGNEALRRSFIKEIVPELITALKKDKSPIWGHLTAQHMVEHLTWTFVMSVGKIEVSCRETKEGLKKMRKFLFSDQPMPHEYKLPELGDGLPNLIYADFQQAQNAFLKSVEKFYEYYETNPKAVHTNPGFGDLGFEEWEYVHFKHCYHHLLQFGLITDEVELKKI